jgi:hypothetical protein
MMTEIIAGEFSGSTRKIQIESIEGLRYRTKGRSALMTDVQVFDGKVDISTPPFMSRKILSGLHGNQGKA